jgi:hypothetical protein
MLPFLKKAKEEASASTTEKVLRKPDDESEEEFDSLEVAAEELLFAIEKKDTKAIAAALRAAFELCDSEPHFEGPHNG